MLSILWETSERLGARYISVYTGQWKFPGGGGGGTQFFSVYVGSDPASTVHPKIIRNFKHTKKLFEILATQIYIPILYLDLKKRP